MNVETVEADGVLVAGQLFNQSATFSRSRSAFEGGGAGTPIVTFAPREANLQEQLLEAWKDVVARLVADMVRQCVQSYVERYFEFAEESDSFSYRPEIVTLSSAEKVGKIRGVRFKEPERIVIYTEAELRNFF